MWFVFFWMSPVVGVDDALATVCMCTELYAIITVQLHVGLYFKYKYTALYNLLLYERQAWVGFIDSRKVHIRRRPRLIASLHYTLCCCVLYWAVHVSLLYWNVKQRSFTCTVHASHSFHQNYVLHLERFKFWLDWFQLLFTGFPCIDLHSLIY